MNPNCICGHPESDHYFDRCDNCLKQLGAVRDGCECPESEGHWLSDGCEHCPGGGYSARYCGGYRAPKPPPPPPVDPNQIDLFDTLAVDFNAREEIA